MEFFKIGDALREHVTSIPEPSSLWLFGVALLVALVLRRVRS